MHRLVMPAVAGGLVVGSLCLLLATSRPAAADNQYVVRRGDTLWAISHRTHVAVGELVRLNHIRNANRIRPGQRLVLHATPKRVASAPPPPAPQPRPALTRAQARALLDAAAARHHLKPSLVEAVSWQESTWNQGAVSPDGAIGLMQVMPGTGKWAGSTLLHRDINLNDPSDNVEVGTTLLARYEDEFQGDSRRVLAAYYQGEWSVQHKGVQKSGDRYATSVLAIQARIDAHRFDYS